MADELIFSGYPVFKAMPGTPGTDLDVQAKEVQALFDEWADRVQVRGSYSTAGFRADADLMFWWVARSADDIQSLTVAFRHTELGRRLDPREQFLGLVRPAEFSPDHQPAFVQGKEPKKYLCLYPFVRTPEWYLLDPRGARPAAEGARRAGAAVPRRLGQYDQRLRTRRLGVDPRLRSGHSGQIGRPDQDAQEHRGQALHEGRDPLLHRHQERPPSRLTRPSLRSGNR